jgi:hypothetical protein
MQTVQTHRRSRAEDRASIERIIRYYPEVTEAELHWLFDYFRNIAGPADLAHFNVNRKIRKQYRALCRDHHVHRLRSGQRIATIVLTAIFALGALLSAAVT